MSKMCQPIQAFRRWAARNEVRDAEGMTPLLRAVFDGRLEDVRSLLDRGADVNAVFASTKQAVYGYRPVGSFIERRMVSDGQTSLHLAPTAAIVQLLLERSARVDVRDRWGAVPLHTVAASGDPDSVRMLLENGASADVNAGDGLTPLHAAAEIGAERSVRLLLEHGADVNALTRDGSSPLAMAAKGAHESVMEVLVASGADVRGHDAAVLHAAAGNGAGATLAWLVGKGACVLGEPRLIHTAAEAGATEAVRFLLDAGLLVDAIGEDGMTPLHMAAMQGHDPVVRLLLDRGADPNARDDAGQTPLHCAALCSLGDGNAIAADLLGFGGNVNAQDAEGRTPLHVALEPRGPREQFEGESLCDPPLVEFLLSQGARPDLRNAAGETPLSVVSGEVWQQWVVERFPELEASDA